MSDNEPPLKVGDPVQLCCGGQVMTVTHVSHGYACAGWFTDYRQKQFPVDALRRVDVGSDISTVKEQAA